MLVVIGLTIAAYIARDGNSEAVSQHAQAPVTRTKPSVTAMAWVDPPARADGLSALSEAVVTTVQAAEVPRSENADTDELRTTQVLQRRSAERKATLARLKAQRQQALAERLQRAKAALQHKLAQRRIRLFQASLTRRVRRVPVADEQAPSPAPPKAAVQSDLIRTLLHGLGLDG